MNTKRIRSRYHRSGNGGGRHQNGQVPFNRNHVFESNGPNARIRGTAQQLYEKYLQQGRDALSSGDRVTAESYFQYAEHYSRILNSINQSIQQRHRPNNFQENASQPDIGKPIENNSAQSGTVESVVVKEEISLSEEQPAPAEVIDAEIIEEKEEKKPIPVRTPRRGRPPRSAVQEKKQVQSEDN